MRWPWWCIGESKVLRSDGGEVYSCVWFCRFLVKLVFVLSRGE